MNELFNVYVAGETETQFTWLTTPALMCCAWVSDEMEIFTMINIQDARRYYNNNNNNSNSNYNTSITTINELN